MINQINQNAQREANAGRIPGGAGLEAKSSANIGSALGGQLPADVMYQIGQQAAERGVSGGSPHGANTNADYLRALGLNSLQLQGTGQDWLTAALARNPAAPIYDPSKLLITPTQATGFNLDQANLELNQQKTSADIANQNAQRQLQSDLANAQNKLERDRLVWQYDQNRLQRENALRISQMEMARRSGYGYGGGSGGGNSGGGGFNPSTNWSGTSTATPTPLTQPWHLPNYPGGSLDTVQPGMDYGGEFDTVQAGMNYDPNLGMVGIYPQGGAINPEGLSQDELDWLYNVGG